MSMIEINGKHNKCKVFTEDIDSSTIGQLTALCNVEVYKENTIRVMPDCHAGIGCVVGTTMTLIGAVTPNLVGIDIGCGMLAIKLKEKRVDLPKFDSIVRSEICAGRDARRKIYTKSTEIDLDKLYCKDKNAPLRIDNAYASIGTLGGGNHFIELDKDTDGNIWLVIHTGSRHLGIEVCNWYQKQAYKELKDIENGGSVGIKRLELANKLKAEGKQQFIERELKRFDKEYKPKEPSISYEMAYCTGSLFEMYIHDMEIVQHYASVNRHGIARIILKSAKLHCDDKFETIHNYIDIKNMILRKGAVSAQSGERLIIPINMRDGSLLCTGKGNPDWNYSAPHGAGRKYSRSDTKQRFSVNEYKQEMKKAGVYTSSVNASTLDECPMAYKDMDSIISNITDTVHINDIIKPIYNFKAGKQDD